MEISSLVCDSRRGKCGSERSIGGKDFLSESSAIYSLCIEDEADCIEESPGDNF